jgi:hypothetical protein
LTTIGAIKEKEGWINNRDGIKMHVLAPFPGFFAFGPASVTFLNLPSLKIISTGRPKKLIGAMHAGGFLGWPVAPP